MASSSASSSPSLGLAVLVLLPVIVAFLWNCLDANPTLYFYDAGATLTGGWQHSSLKNQTIWITGASSGIGASLACQALQAGAAHVILSSRKRDKLLQVASKCQAMLGASYSPERHKMSIVPYDAANGTAAHDVAVVQRVLKSCDGELDMVVLNAGIYQNQPALLTTKEERDRITRVNYQAPVDLTEALIQTSNWKQQQRGHIVVVSSVMAHGPYGLSSTYAASKAALKSYFLSLSTEESSWLTIRVACPGQTDTNFWSTQESLPTQGAAMTPDRVAHLIWTGVAGPWWLFYETHVAKLPGLLFVWMSHYLPDCFHAFGHFLSYIRVPIWHHEHIDALDVPFLLQRFAQIVMGTYPPSPEN